jgi:hypothetical protein
MAEEKSKFRIKYASREEVREAFERSKEKNRKLLEELAEL